VFKAGRINTVCYFPGSLLNEGTYTISKLLIVKNKGNVIAEFNDLLSFDLLPETNNDYFGWVGKKEGVLKLKSVRWQVDFVTW
jgi:lipopolysaccharide transport system ATP-binding protein